MKTVKIILLAIILVSLVSCSSLKPDATVKTFFEAVQRFDFDEMANTIVPDKQVEVLVEISEIQSQNDEMPKEFYDFLRLNAGKLTYKILDAQVTGDNATVSVSVNYIDAGPIIQATLGEFFVKMLGLSFGGTEPTEEMTEEMFMTLLNEQIELQEEKFKEKTVEVNLEKINDVWYVADINDDLLDIVMSGFISALEGINNAFSLNQEPADEAITSDGPTPTPDPKNVLYEINNFVISDIWNDGFNVFVWYLQTGKGPTGGSVDIDFTKTQLTLAMTKKAEYDVYIAGLDDSYSSIKDVWNKLSSEIDSLYQQIQAGAQTLDTGLFVQYRDAFSKLIYDL